MSVAAKTVAPRVSPSDLFTPEEWAPFQARSAWKGPMMRKAEAVQVAPTHDYDSIVTGRSVLPFVVVNLAMLAGFVAAGVWWA